MTSQSLELSYEEVDLIREALYQLGERTCDALDAMTESDEPTMAWRRKRVAAVHNLLQKIPHVPTQQR